MKKSELEQAWEDIERREAEQEAADLAFVETEWSSTWPKTRDATNITGPYRYVDYVRRCEARERQRNGEKRVPARVRLGSMFERILSAPVPTMREAGWEE